MEYYATEAWQENGNAAGVEPRNIPELVALNTQGRMTLVDGDDQEIVDGIRVYTGPRHSFASQYVGVNTSDGTVVVASDCIWFYANLELGLAKHRISGFDDTWQVTLSAQMPLFFWQPAIGEIREANSNSRALGQEAAHLRNLISLEVAEAHRGYLTAVTQIELMENQILSQAEEVYEMYLFSYQQGEIGGIELIAAVSAPTSLAIEVADKCNITLCAFVRETRARCSHTRGV